MFYIISNIILFIIALTFILFTLLKKFPNNSYLNNLYQKYLSFIDKYFKTIVCVIFGLALFTSIFKLGEVPYGLHVDEAGMAYDAFCISKYGVDRYLNTYPIYLINYGGGQSAMYAYLVAFLIKLFGYSVQIIRLPAVILRLLIFVSCLFIIKDENNKNKNIIFLFLLAIVPYFIMQSRWGLDCNLLVGFLTIAICFLIQSVKKNNNTLLLFTSGVFFGLSLYTYALSYIIVPIFLLLVCIYFIYIKKFNLKSLISLGVPIFIFAIPLMLMILINNGFINEIKGFVTIPMLKNYRGSEVSLSNIGKNLYIFLSILSFDKDKILIYNSLPYFGTIYYFTIPFFIIGLLKCIKNFILTMKAKNFNIDVIFVFWFFSVILCQLLISAPNINKSNAIFVPVVYFSAVGIIYIINKSHQLLLPILLIFFINFGLFFNYYFYHYNDDTKYQYFFATNYLDALEYSNNLDTHTIYIENDLTAQEHIYILLYNFISPYNYAEDNIESIYNNKKITYVFGIPEEINTHSVYITRNDQESLKKFEDLGFEITNFGNITVFY